MLAQLYSGDDTLDPSSTHPRADLVLRGWNHKATRRSVADIGGYLAVMGRRYENPLDSFGEDWGYADLDGCISSEDIRLPLVPVVAGLYGEDLARSVDICVRLSRHPSANVRGNALLGFGHLARRFGGSFLDDAIAVLLSSGRNDDED